MQDMEEDGARLEAELGRAVETKLGENRQSWLTWA